MISHPMFLMRATACAAALLITAPAVASSPSAEAPSWSPKASETLVKLPAAYLKKNLDQDFIDSQLGRALTETETNIELKGKTLSDLKAAIGQARGDDLKMELRHQLLAEKRAFIDLMSRKNDMKRQRATTKLKLFENMIRVAGEKNGRQSPDVAALIEKQDAAHRRFAKSAVQVDMRVFETGQAPESRYAAQYAENLQAIEKLMGRISAHSANQAAVGDDGTPISREEHLRHLMLEAQAELSLLDQEDTVLGYMAKLVALDALALSEQALDADLADSNLPGDVSAAKAVSMFLGN
ncbi:MAG: hypothetical protein CMM77_00385 [Rhodospirillaceae bacterium]|jgi:hypothetical protein|nr:hypothetical protein [Magnetovibrio sp.]MAY65564.1 hypothetical protein [Rhodospirillaceae bacterium]